MRDVLVAAILAGAFVLALWGGWRPHYRRMSYVVAGVVVAALIAVLAATHQANLVILSIVMLALFAALTIINDRRAQRSRGR
jgi:small-conductance mechanosensitive channel